MAPFVGLHGQTHGAESGYVISTGGPQHNLDPGLTGVERNGEGRVSLQGASEDLGRTPELTAEHTVLTQIAVAAAGTR